MKIHEYNEMMAWLTRPTVNRTGFKYGGTWKDYMLRGEEYKDLSFEEWLREDKAQGGVIGKGGMFPGEDMGYRTGYSQLGGSKIPLSVLNKGAQYFYGVDYDELETDSELTKEKKRSKIYSKINDHYKRTGEYKFVVKTQDKPLSTTDQNKIKKQFPNAKFGPKRKYGFAPTDPEYGSVFRFVENDFKLPYEGGMFKSLPKYAQQELIEAFPEVDFNFDRNIEFSTTGSRFSKYGVPVNHPKYAKISKYFAKSKPWKYGFDLRSPEGWMMSQMERAYAQGNKEYKPITKNNKPIAKGNPMIGIEHNGKKYNMKTITNHPDFKNTKKYWNIADKTSKKYLTQFDNLAKLLPEGFDPAKIQLNDLLQFIADKDGVTGLNRAKRAIEIHHEYGVKGKTTGSYQLLRQDVNLLANKASNLIKKGGLSNIEKGAAEALAKGVRLNVDDVQYGPAKISATGDIKNIIAGAETELKSFTKKDWNNFSKELTRLNTTIVGENAIAEGITVCTTGGGKVKKASGGRIGYGKKCYKGQELMDFVRENPEEAMKAFKASKEVNASMAKNPSKWLKAGRLTARELGPLGIIGGEILFGGALTMMELGQGKTVWEALDNGFLYGLAGVEDKTLLDYANRFENITDEEKGYIKKALDISKKAPAYEKILQTMSKMDSSKLTTTAPGIRGMGEGRERPTAYARYKTLADKKLAEIQEIKGDMTKDQATVGQFLVTGAGQMKGMDEAWRKDKIKESQIRAMESAFDHWSAAEGGRAGFNSGTIPGGYTDDAYEYIREIEMDIAKAFKKYKAAGGKLDFDTYSSEAKRAMFNRDIPTFRAEGGRIGFDEGSKPKNPGRRAFLKGITALAALPIVGKFFKMSDVVNRPKLYTGPAIDKATKGMPEWFPGLVKKLWNEGEDVTKKMAYNDRQIVKRGTLESGDDVDLIYQMDTGDVSINVSPKKGKYETGSGAYNKEYSLDYQKGIADEGTGGKPADEFGVAEGRPYQVGPDDVELDYDQFIDVDDALSDLTELEAFAKNQSTKQIHKKKGTKPKDTSPTWEPPDYDD